MVYIPSSTDKPLVAIPRKYRRYLDEELSLVKTLYREIGDVIIVNHVNQKYYLPSTRIEELKDSSYNPIIIMDRVKPRQMINILRETRKEVIDRILLILEIFAEHAGSREAKLQIELARLKHWYPIIKETIRYAKLGELHGFLGAGKYGYEKYYVMLKEKEARIRRELEKLRKIRNIRRKNRFEKGYIHVSIAGYTCAGKTTLFNKITGAGKPVGPEPFTTLTPKTSALILDNSGKIMFTDTVGFIRDLPPEIVEAFYATLEEIAESDIIIDVIDSSKDLDSIIDEVREANNIFSKLGIHGKPIIYVLNKIDRIDREGIDEIAEKIHQLAEYYNQKNHYVLPVSAYTGENVDKLIELIKKLIEGVEINAKDIRAEIWS